MMTKDFRCACGHPMAGSHTDAGCRDCDCQLIPLRETDPINDVKAGAISAHELLIAYVDAGFTRDEALHMVTAVTIEGIRSAQR